MGRGRCRGMNRFLSFAAAACAASISASAWAAPQLEQVAAFPRQQVTGVTVSKDGRIFVNFPYWSDEHTVSVVELKKDGTQVPFPNAAWNSKDEKSDPQRRWVCVQSVVADDENNLWVLDPASPKMGGVVKGGAKLVKIELATGEVAQVIAFGSDVAPSKSYLNDVRIDTKTKTAYLTESGVGSLVVVDLQTGKARAVLGDHYSAKAEATDMIVDGKRPISVKTKTIPVFHADGIALDRSSGTLYFHALTGHALYRVSTNDLRNPKLSAKELGAKVAKVADTPKPDGLLESPDGKVWLAAFVDCALVCVDPTTGKSEVVVQDKRLQWPDTLAWGPDGYLYVTTSQIHRTPMNNNGVDEVKDPYGVWRVKVGK